MTVLRIEKVLNALPGSLSPDTLYFVKDGSTVDTYITDSSGSTAFKTSGSDTGNEDQLDPFLLMGAV